MELKFFEPQEKQREFLTAKTRYVCYGGARGGGKSWCVRFKAEALCLNNDGIKVLILRKTFKELQENHIQYIEEDLKPMLEAKGPLKVRHDKTNHVFIFPNGSRLKYGYCETISDAKQYQGLEYDVIFMEEATHFLYEMFTMINACIRGNNQFPKRMYLTCNPGGVGHEWVKRLFVTKEYLPDEIPEEYTFIRAKATDNKYVGEGYMKYLNSLQEPLRSAWRDGDWNTFVGQYFPEWGADDFYIDMPNIQSNWIISQSIDYGLDRFAPVWYTTDENGTDIIIYGTEFSNTIVSEAARITFQIEKNLGLSGIRIRRYAPPDLFHRTGQTGKSTIDMFNEYGLYFMRSDNNREAGWLAIKEKIQDGTLKCVKGQAPELNKNMRIIQYDEDKVNDCANEPHDITHSPDSLRYFCIMNRQKAKPLHVEHKVNYFTHDIEPKKPKGKMRINAKVFAGGWNG